MRKLVELLDLASLTAPLRTYLGRGTSTVVWVDRGDELIVYASQLQVRFRPGAIVCQVPLESCETKRAVLKVTIAVATVDEAPSLIAATQNMPEGNELLAARWGYILQEVIWGALLDLLSRYAGERQPIGFRLAEKGLELVTKS